MFILKTNDLHWILCDKLHTNFAESLQYMTLNIIISVSLIEK